MPTTPETTYCTPEDVRTYTNNAELADDDNFTDDELAAKIVAAEMYIDSEAGYWDRAGGITQARVFPRVEDAQIGVDIPEAIMHATIAQVEFMHVNMPDVDHGIEPDASPTRASLSPRAKRLMRGFSKKTGNITLPYSVSPALLTTIGVDTYVGDTGDIHFKDLQ